MNPLSQFDARTILAFLITGFAIVGTSTLSIAIITSGEPAKANERASLVLNSTLPLFGTWVGTVLAYYFARENFEAASRSTERFAQLTSQANRDDLQSIPVATAMTARSKMFAVNEVSTSIADIIRLLDEKEFRRLPVLESETDFPESLVYYEDLIRYYYSKEENVRSSLTLQIFLNDSTTSKKPFAVIDSEATLALAKEAMKKIPECRDVYVTKTGKPDSAVIGFLSNVDFDKFSRV